MPVKKTVKTVRAKSPRLASKPIKKASKKVSWDDIQAGFKELHELHKITEKTLNKAIEETRKTNEETERTLRKAHEETERTLNKAIGGISNTLGSIVEHILTPGLPQKFRKLGYSFNRIATYKFAEGVYAQIDGMLENGEQAVAVEVKTTLRQSDIDDHLLRMEKIRKYADEHGDRRHFMGAMAATITDEATRNYALKKGLFVIEPSGEDVKVTKPEGEVRVW
ncbi:MAG: hypothetical protein LBU85_00250 [Treponema sp.]|nr:hypothetical protein [Treponema sp.]